MHVEPRGPFAGGRATMPYAMASQKETREDLQGPLHEVESQRASRKVSPSVDADVPLHDLCVTVVGSREPSPVRIRRVTRTSVLRTPLPKLVRRGMP